MQHGPLTPLGRQLRSVLANFTTHTSHYTNGPCNRTFTSARRQRDAVDSERGLASSAIYTPFSHTRSETPAAVDEAALGHNRVVPRNDRPQTENHANGHGPQTRTDHLTEALKDTGHLAQDLSNRRKKIDYTYVDPQSRTIRHDSGQKDDIADDERHACSYHVSIQRILGDLIRHKAASVDHLAAEWEQPFELSSEQTAFLRQRGLALQNIEAWADIATAKDPFDAAQKLAQYVESHDSQWFPIFVYLNLLKRDYLGARALRLLIHQASTIFGERAQSLPDPDIDQHPTLLAVIRLLRHAREVWPQSMPAIVQLMLDHLARRESQRPYDREELSSVTYQLNKIMGLVSYATAVQPFKDNPYQEAAIVPVLRYMADHDPPLQIDRQGYRAVIRIQLAQKKTPNELQWAELKALSWPPWKVDRTAMDASIDAEYGASRASATLARMREAGYGPLDWEKTAELYTGWDPDGTPTVQMRALLEQPGARMSSTCSQHVHTWAAKISTTRTIQEAWACYLAWEDLKLPQDQAVYMAILTKLRQEELRQHGRQNYRSRAPRRQAWPLLPGDGIEISPLPPSTHLYTYTRTRPPTVDEFYHTLTSRSVAFKGYCLAFLIRNATTLQVAVRRMKDSTSTYPDIAGVLVSDSTCDIAKIPPPIYAAIVEVFASFGRVPLVKASVGLRTSNSPLQERFNIQPRLNPTLSITRAIELLRDRAVMHRRLWTVLLKGLTNARNHAALSTAFSPQRRSLRICGKDFPNDGGQDNSQLPLELQRHAGAINAHRIARRLLALMRQNHLDPDMMAFHSFCLSTESMAIAAWSVLRKSVLEDTAIDKYGKPFELLVQDTRTILHKQNHHNRLKGEFRILVGVPDQTMLPAKSTDDPSDALEVPRLLVVPGPAILHAYIRALGWLADHDGLLATVRWMHEHRKELTERQSHDRNGADMMRRAMVALRVFLERSWLAYNARDDEPADGFSPGSQRLLLSRLRRPAGSEVIAAVREIVENVEEWEGWPTDEEVEEYAADKRFDQTKDKISSSA